MHLAASWLGFPAVSGAELVVTEEDRRHWSFGPLHGVTPPEVHDSAWLRTPVDRFIRHALEAKGLTPTTPASRRTLIRRVTFDLLGLPPTPEEIESFVRDPDPRAYEKLVDRLLASPHYGERWARHWLDIARYADSAGQESDDDRPNAYHFRDFVIGALNDDLPYDVFVRWQIAGDELEPSLPRAIAATGFLVAGSSTFLDVPMEEEKLRNRANELDDIVSTTSQALLALTLGCARCHDHKYDAIPSRDYYRFMRAFNGGDRAEVPLVPPERIRAHKTATEKWQSEHSAAIKRRDEWLDKARAPFLDVPRFAKIDKLPIREEEKQLLREKPEDSDAKALAKKYAKDLKVESADYVALLSPEEKTRWQELEAEVKTIAARKPSSLPTTFAFADFAPEARETWFFERGNFMARNQRMELGFLSVLMRGKTAEDYWNAARQARKREDTTQQRRAMAEWITDRDHGAGLLLARVLVNRVWQHHFGEGLVRTPSDFGTRGEKPSHPQLLEWLTGEFLRQGWRLKPLHRLLVTSAVYLQDTTLDPAKAAIDPENRLLWRRRPLRLESEILRDSMLATAGTINLAMFGPSFKPPIAVEAMQARNVKNPYPRDVADRPATRRRTIYMFHKRVVQYPLMQAFDAPDAQVSCGRRLNTTVAPQALALLNDPFVRLRAGEMAGRLFSERDDTTARIRRAFQLCVGRNPDPEELAAANAFLTNQISGRRARESKAGAEDLDRLALTDFCQTLFALNEFIYVD